MKALCENCKRTNHEHKFQDELLGKFVREFNKTLKGGKDKNICKCTVCSGLQEIKQAQLESA